MSEFFDDDLLYKDVSSIEAPSVGQNITYDSNEPNPMRRAAAKAVDRIALEREQEEYNSFVSLRNRRNQNREAAMQDPTLSVNDIASAEKFSLQEVNTMKKESPNFYDMYRSSESFANAVEGREKEVGLIERTQDYGGDLLKASQVGFSQINRARIRSIQLATGERTSEQEASLLESGGINESRRHDMARDGSGALRNQMNVLNWPITAAEQAANIGGALLSGAVGSVVGGAVGTGGAPDPTDVATVPIGMVAGRHLGVFTFAAGLERGLLADELISAREARGEPVDLDEINKVATFGGVVNGVAETLAIGLFAKVLPTPLRRKLKIFDAKDALRTVIGQKGATERISGIMGKYLANIAGETGTEAFQEMTNALAGLFDESGFESFGDVLRFASSNETISRVAHAGFAGLQTSAVLGLPGTVSNSYSASQASPEESRTLAITNGSNEVYRSAAGSSQIADMAAWAQEHAEQIEKDPQALQDYVERVLSDGETQSVHVDARGVQELLDQIDDMVNQEEVGTEAEIFNQGDLLEDMAANPDENVIATDGFFEEQFDDFTDEQGVVHDGGPAQVDDSEVNESGIFEEIETEGSTNVEIEEATDSDVALSRDGTTSSQLRTAIVETIGIDEAELSRRAEAGEFVEINTAAYLSKLAIHPGAHAKLFGHLKVNEGDWTPSALDHIQKEIGRHKAAAQEGAEIKTQLDEEESNLREQIKDVMVDINTRTESPLTDEQVDANSVIAAARVTAHSTRFGVSYQDAIDAVYPRIVATEELKNEQGKPVPLQDPVEEFEAKVHTNLSAATGTISGLDILHERALAGDDTAANTLNHVAMDSLTFLTSGIPSIQLGFTESKGIYSGTAEPALSIAIDFDESDRPQALAALAKFAVNFDQEQVHVRQAATQGDIGHQYVDTSGNLDGSYNTNVVVFTLSGALSSEEVLDIVDKSGLQAATTTDNKIETYFSGNPENAEEHERFNDAIHAARELLGERLTEVSTRTERLWAYGDGVGSTNSYGEISGDIHPKNTGQSSRSARRLATLLAGADVDPAAQKEITEEQDSLQTEIADVYESLAVNNLEDPNVLRAYAELAEEVEEQFLLMPIKSEIFEGEGEPYSGKNMSDLMREDVNLNNHIYVFGTDADNFGPPGVVYDGHPLLEDSGYKDIKGKPLLYNDLLRIVHDYYAHTMSQVGFGPKGEEAAWRNHMLMTKSPWARWALTSETRGQNSWVNFNATSRQIKKLSERPFAEQKVDLMPLKYMLTGDARADANVSELPGSSDLKNPDSPEYSPLFQVASTRVPYTKINNKQSNRLVSSETGEIEDHIADLLTIGLEPILAVPEHAEKVASAVSTYPMMRPSKKDTSPEKVLNRFVNQGTDNLLWVFDQIPQEIRDRSKLWYKGANVVSHKWADAYGLDHKQVSGIIAVMSPQKDWYQNASLAERVINIMNDAQDAEWTPKMAKANNAIPKGMASQSSAKDWRREGKRVIGKKFSELETELDKAHWIRVYDKAYSTPSYRIISPEGEFVDVATNDDGSDSKVAWGSKNEIGKAISIFENGDFTNIDEQLGRKHKVRNFYNNIYDPDHEAGFVTIDTHAVAAVWLQPFAADDLGPKHNFGSSPKGIKSAGSTGVSGASGTYGLYAEMYTKAAAARGILPREMQSIVWEGVKELFLDTYKTNKANKKASQDILNKYRKGTLSLEKSRQQIVEHAGGFKDPQWTGELSNPTHGSQRDSSYRDELPQHRLERGDTSGREQSAGRVRGGDSLGDSGGRQEANQGLDLQPVFQAVSRTQDGPTDGTRQRKVTPAEKAYFDEIFGSPGDLSELTEQVPSATYDGQTFSYATADESGLDDWINDTEILKQKGERIPPSFRNSKFLFQAVNNNPPTRGIAANPRTGETAIFSSHPDAIRGYFDPSKVDFGSAGEIGMSKLASPATFIHEAAHSHLFSLISQAQAGHKEAQEDLTIVMQWLGVKRIEDLIIFKSDTTATKKAKTAYHEKFADGAIVYYAEGKAPALSLQKIFDSFRVWLMEYYQSLVDSGIELSPPVREVFGRMVAADTEIATAKDILSATPISNSILKMKPEDYQKYVDNIDKSIRDAKRSLDQKTIRDANSGKTGAYTKRLAQIRKALRSEIEEERAYVARRAMQGTDPDKIKLTRESVRQATAGKEFEASINARSSVLVSNEPGRGQDAELIAEEFGYANAYDMLDDLAHTPRLKDAVEQRALEQMEHEAANSTDLITINDDTTPDAQSALHTKSFENAIVAELTAFQELTGRKAGYPVSVLKANAKTLIDRTKIKDVNPEAYIRAERIAAGRAIEAAGKGDFQTALEQTKTRLYNQYIYREARDRIKQTKRKLKKLKKLTGAKGLKQIDDTYKSHIASILNRFDLRVNAKVVNPELEASDNQKFIADEGQNGVAVRINEDNPIYKEALPWHQLTMEQFDQVSEAMDNLVTLGKNTKTISPDGEVLDLQETADDLRESLMENIKERLATLGGTPNKAAKLLKSYWVDLRKRGNIARKWDGFNDSGIAQRILIGSMNGAQGKEEQRLEVEYEALRELFAKYNMDSASYLKRKEKIKGSKPLTREEILSVALNHGNAYNRARQLESIGRKMLPGSQEGSEARAQTVVDDILNHVTKEEWNFVQDVWDYFDTFWSEIAALEVRTTGVKPTRVEPVAFTTGTGVIMRGGYYPVAYDAGETTQSSIDDIKAEANQAMSGFSASAQTSHGHSKERVGSGGRILTMSLSPIFNHVGSVVHDLTHRETLQGLYKLINEPSLKAEMVGRLGVEDHKAWGAWLSRVAIGDQQARNSMERIGGFFRGHVTIMGLGLNFSTAALQMMGLTQSSLRIGNRWVASGLTEYLSTRGNPKAFREAIDAKSPLMANRSQSFQRDVRELETQLHKNRALTWWERTLFSPIVLMQGVVDGITWTGAYNKAIHGGAEESAAVLQADLAVKDSQGSGRLADLSGIEGGSPWQKMFTTFYSFMNTMLNMGADEFNRIQMSDKNAVMKMGAAVNTIFMLYILPAMFTSYVLDILIAGEDPEDDDEWIAWATQNQVNYLVGQFPFFREMIPNGYRYSGPAGMRFFTTIQNGIESARNAVPGGDPFGGEDVSLLDNPLEFMDSRDVRNMIDAAGTVLPLPTTSIKRVISGSKRIQDGETDGPVDAITGLTFRKARQ